MTLPLLGFDPTIIAVAGVISTLWGIVGHTQIIGNLGPLEWIFNTPSHHRVHHGANPQYIDKNYGNLFIIWDRIFGTYTFVNDSKSIVYGIDTHINDRKIDSFTNLLLIPFKKLKKLKIQSFLEHESFYSFLC